MRISRAILYGAQVFLSFFLMLVFMTYNVCSAFELQHFIKYLLVSRRISSLPPSLVLSWATSFSILTWTSKAYWLAHLDLARVCLAIERLLVYRHVYALTPSGFSSSRAGCSLSQVVCRYRFVVIVAFVICNHVNPTLHRTCRIRWQQGKKW